MATPRPARPFNKREQEILDRIDILIKNGPPAASPVTVNVPSQPPPVVNITVLPAKSRTPLFILSGVVIILSLVFLLSRRPAPAIVIQTPPCPPPAPVVVPAPKVIIKVIQIPSITPNEELRKDASPKQ